jgi:hypothetical protein
MTKKVSFRARPPTAVASSPSAGPNQAAIDAWVNDELLAGSEPMKRFTFEVPLSLHKRIKMRQLLELHFPPESSPANGHSESQMR